ncbi:MAG: hypothetical protein GX175_11070 [Halanaerobiaceae bacterium]|nr:hypothetical protein [Halanaerobiaceae bacterium]
MKQGGTMYKVLIVEDSKSLCNNIKEGICRWVLTVLQLKNLQTYNRSVPETIPIRA